MGGNNSEMILSATRPSIQIVFKIKDGITDTSRKYLDLWMKKGRPSGINMSRTLVTQNQKRALEWQALRPEAGDLPPHVAQRVAWKHTLAA